MRLLPLLFVLLSLPCAAQTQADYDTFIRQAEGFRWQPYRDGTGYSVGYAHRIPKGQLARFANLSGSHLDELYQVDLATAYGAAISEVTDWGSHPREVRVLIVALAFNLGATGLHDFTNFIAAINARDYLKASRELCDSRWARQVSANRLQTSLSILTRAALTLPSTP